MLPCQNTCTHYQENCHKTCAWWQRYQSQQRQQRQAKKAYLKHYRELCTTVTRQYWDLQPRRVVR